ARGEARAEELVVAPGVVAVAVHADGQIEIQTRTEITTARGEIAQLPMQGELHVEMIATRSAELAHGAGAGLQRLAPQRPALALTLGALAKARVVERIGGLAQQLVEPGGALGEVGLGGDVEATATMGH